MIDEERSSRLAPSAGTRPVNTPAMTANENVNSMTRQSNVMAMLTGTGRFGSIDHSRPVIQIASRDAAMPPAMKRTVLF